MQNIFLSFLDGQCFLGDTLHVRNLGKMSSYQAHAKAGECLKAMSFPIALSVIEARNALCHVLELDSRVAEEPGTVYNLKTSLCSVDRFTSEI